MAQRRMFSLSVVDTDSFLSLPVSAQNLYFHFGMRADDDGFVASPKKIMSFVKSTEDDFRILVVKGYIIPFKSGVCVIREWKINNYMPYGLLTVNQALEILNLPSVEGGDKRLQTLNVVDAAHAAEYQLKDGVQFGHNPKEANKDEGNQSM